MLFTVYMSYTNRYYTHTLHNILYTNIHNILVDEKHLKSIEEKRLKKDLAIKEELALKNAATMKKVSMYVVYVYLFVY